MKKKNLIIIPSKLQTVWNRIRPENFMSGGLIWIQTICIDEARIGVLVIQDICHFTSRDNGSSLLSGILDTVFNILVTFRDIESLGRSIMGIFARCLI